MCQFFSHFLAVMRYRDAFGIYIAPKKMDLKCACKFKIMSTKSRKKNVGKHAI